MENLSEATCIKKLVKYIYSQQKQIDNLKKSIRQHNRQPFQNNANQQIDPLIKTQLQNSSYQLKEVNKLLKIMQARMRQLENDLQQEILKNNSLQKQIKRQRQLYTSLNQMAQQRPSLCDVTSKSIREIEQVRQSEKYLKVQLNKLSQQLQYLKNKQTYNERKLQLIQKQLNEMKTLNKKYEIELKNKQQQIKINSLQNDLIKQKLQEALKELKNQNKQLKSNRINSNKQILQKQQILALNHQLNSMNQQLIQIQKQYQNKIEIKDSQLTQIKGQFKSINQKLKDFQQFAYQIQKHIQSTFIKYCLANRAKSSRKMIKQLQTSYKYKFQTSISRFLQLQQWMQDIQQKLKSHQITSLPNITLQNLSNIAQSFEQKLYLCDLTQNLQRQKQQIQRNQQFLLKNLQKQCEKSYERQRSKIVELDEMKQILKMTKQVNRQLMDEVNKKQYTISQCKKICKNLFGNKQNIEYRHLKRLLNI